MYHLFLWPRTNELYLQGVKAPLDVTPLHVFTKLVSFFFGLPLFPRSISDGSASAGEFLHFTEWDSSWAFQLNLTRLYLAESWDSLDPTGPLDSPEWLGTAGCLCRCLCPYLLEKVSCLLAATHTTGRRDAARNQITLRFQKYTECLYGGQGTGSATKQCPHFFIPWHSN